MSDKLLNPFPGLTDDTAGYVHAKIPNHIFNYFFNHVLTGDRGYRQTLVCIFFQKLYEQCQSVGIAPTWDATNEGRVAGIVANLNFESPTPTPAVSRPERPVRAGRADSRPPVGEAKPAHSDSHGRRTPRHHTKAPHPRNVGPDTVSETQGGL